MARIYKVQVNIDDMSAELDTLPPSDHGSWLAGFRCGCRGRILEHMQGPMRMGAEFGLSCYKSAEAFRESRVAGGKARHLNDKREPSECSARAQHMQESCSADAQHKGQLSNIQYPVSSNQKPKTKNTSADAPDELFDLFWDTYQKKDSKIPALKAWRRLTDEEKQLAIDFAPRMVAIKPDPQYRPLPATYLNNKRWLDESLSDSRPNAESDEDKLPTPSPEDWAYARELDLAEKAKREAAKQAAAQQ